MPTSSSGTRTASSPGPAAASGGVASGGSSTAPAAGTGTSASGLGARAIVSNTIRAGRSTVMVSWGTVGWVAVWDNLTGGNLLFHGALTSSKTIASGDVFRIPAGDLDITLD